MSKVLKNKALKTCMAFLIAFTGLFISYAQAAMIPTTAVITTDGVEYTQQELQSALTSDELKAQLEGFGVNVEQLSDRIESLTVAEIQQLNADLQEQPAGGIVGTLVTIFVVLVVTDMLCATDVFTFVRCINK